MVNKKCFKITFEPAYPLVEQIVPLAAPTHILRESWLRWLKSIEGLDNSLIKNMWIKWLDEHFSLSNNPKISSGPFKITKWTKNHLILERNNLYWKPSKVFKNTEIKLIKYIFYSSLNKLKEEINKSILDVITAPDLSADFYNDMEEDIKSTYSTENNQTYNWQHITINHFKESKAIKELELDKNNIKKALIHGIDRQKISMKLFSSLDNISHSFVHIESEYYNKNISKYDYNPNLSLALFEQEGWNLHEDGILRKKNKEFLLRLCTTQGDNIQHKIIEMLVEDYKKMGIIVNVIDFTNEQFVNEVYIKGSEDKFDLTLYCLSENPKYEKGERYTSYNYQGSNIPMLENQFQGSNVGGWVNETYSLLFKRAQSQKGLERITTFHKMQDIWTEELPSIPLLFRSELRILRKGLNNFAYNLHERVLDNVYWNLNEGLGVL